MKSKGHEKVIQDLLTRGRALLEAPRQAVNFHTGIAKAEELLNNIDRFPHIYVLGCVMDRQIKTGRAWSIPYRIGEKLGSFEFTPFCDVSEAKYSRMFKTHRYHRFNGKMAKYFYQAIQRINDEYDGDAAKIWLGTPSSALVIRRFLQFDGVGVKIATMAVNILVRHFKISMRDFNSIDISPDSRVTRFFVKHGLIDAGASRDELIYLAREISPEFPGLLDYAAFLDGEYKRLSK